MKFLSYLPTFSFLFFFRLFLVNHSANWRAQAKIAHNLILEKKTIGEIIHVCCLMASPLACIFENEACKGWNEVFFYYYFVILNYFIYYLFFILYFFVIGTRRDDWKWFWLGPVLSPPRMGFSRYWFLSPFFLSFFFSSFFLLLFSYIEPFLPQ